MQEEKSTLIEKGVYTTVMELLKERNIELEEQDIKFLKEFGLEGISITIFPDIIKIYQKKDRLIRYMEIPYNNDIFYYVGENILL